MQGDEPTVLGTVAKLLKTVHACNDRGSGEPLFRKFTRRRSFVHIGSAPARACLDRGESFAAAVSRTRRSGLAIPAILRDLAGRLGSSLVPSGGAPGVAPFAGLLPSVGWTRGR
jgi:hypothetical protein